MTVNSYFKYSEPIEPHIETLEKVLDHYKDEFVIISADANAMSPLWHSSLEDERETKLESLIISRDLYVCNKRSELTTFENARGQC